MTCPICNNPIFEDKDFIRLEGVEFHELGKDDRAIITFDHRLTEKKLENVKNEFQNWANKNFRFMIINSPIRIYTIKDTPNYQYDLGWE